jgi:hypothetical protein
MERTKAQDIIDDLREDGYSDRQIKDALEDGAYLATLKGVTQADIEEAHTLVSK